MLGICKEGNVPNIYMIGIGGVSMSGIALMLKHYGYNVYGSDVHDTETVHKLIDSGIHVTIGSNIEQVKKADVLVYTAAIKQTDVELVEAKKHNIPTMERAEFLGELTKKYNNTICISGTHGKTTTTSMVSLCFLEANMDPTIQVGANLKQIDGNLHLGNSEHFIIEACEYVESFLHFHPKSEIILNIDNDHLDYFKNIENIKNAFAKFVELLPKDGVLVINSDDNNCLELKQSAKGTVITYGIKNENANFIAKNIRIDDEGFHIFDVYKNGTFYENIHLSVPGIHNVMNALSCIALCDFYNIDKKFIKSALKKFTGANRRFEYIGKYNDAQIYDDYAHHPTEIKATANALKNKKYKTSWAVFQPHTYSRTYNLLEDFVEALSEFDNIIVTDIYAARETNTYNIYPEDIVNKLKAKGKNTIFISGYENIAEYVKQKLEKDDILITIGAGPVVETAHILCEKIS